MLTPDDIKRIANVAAENPYPHDGIKEFMTSTSVTDAYYAFLYHLSKEMAPDFALECGIELGRSLYSIAAGSPATQVVGIEIIGQVPSTYIQFLGQHQNIRIVGGTDATQWLSNPYNRRRRIGLAHIDSTHDFDTVMNEWYLIRPLMEPGGVVCFDDVAHDGPRKLLEEIALEKVLFTPNSPPALHGANGYGAVLIPGG